MSTKQQINSYNKVKNLIESKNGLLFSKLDDYQNTNSIAEYECGFCKRKDEDLYRKITARKGYCKHCEIDRRNLNKGFTTEILSKKLSKFNVKLKCELNSNKQYLKLECRCGKEFERRYCNLSNQGCLCNECKHNEALAYMHNTIIDFYRSHNCKVLHIGEYTDGTNTNSHIKFECSCGRIDEKTYGSFKMNPYCSKCTKRIKGTGKGNLTNDEVKEYVELNSDCKLISTDYKNSNSKLLLECSCGKEFTTVFQEFKHGNKRQCNDCGREHIRGANNHRWKGGITNEHDKIRKSKEYIHWRKTVYEKDNYTCQCCGNDCGGNLQAHHIDNFSNHENSRFDVNNGITLCKECHDPTIVGSFHYEYGTRNNNIEQLQEYINNRRVELNLPLYSIDRYLQYRGDLSNRSDNIMETIAT